MTKLKAAQGSRPKAWDQNNTYGNIVKIKHLNFWHKLKLIAYYIFAELRFK